MSGIRRTWSNKIIVVDAMLRDNNLKGAKKVALSILKDPEHAVMLMDEEIEYLKATVALEKIAEIMESTDFTDMENPDE